MNNPSANKIKSNVHRGPSLMKGLSENIFYRKPNIKPKYAVYYLIPPWDFLNIFSYICDNILQHAGIVIWQFSGIFLFLTITLYLDTSQYFQLFFSPSGNSGKCHVASLYKSMTKCMSILANSTSDSLDVINYYTRYMMIDSPNDY